jgi:hypothetical protein
MMCELKTLAMSLMLMQIKTADKKREEAQLRDSNYVRMCSVHKVNPGLYKAVAYPGLNL